jgi:hypothetical protein
MAGVRREPNVVVQEALKELARMKENKGKVGWLESNNYPDGTSVAYVALIQEMGSPKNGIPPRPFFRPTIAAKSNTWKNQFKSGARAILAGNETASTVMEKVVSGATGEIRKTISQLKTPELSLATIQRRQSRGNTSAKPLIDTGLMLQTLTYSVGTEK